MKTSSLEITIFLQIQRIRHMPSALIRSINQKLELGYVNSLEKLSQNYKRFRIEFQKENERGRTLRRRCSSGMPATFPISPGMYSTRASAENGLDPEATEARRRRAWFDKRCRVLAIAGSRINGRTKTRSRLVKCKNCSWSSEDQK